ncbi:MAG: hypothetical protein AB7V58_10170 [Solirubrobacterales bacterium]
MSDQVRILAGDRGPGRRIPLLAIATVVIALITGLVVGRVTAPDHHSTTTTVAPAPDGQAARRIGTIPVGYPHTRAGAVAATLNAGAVLGDPRVLLDPDRRTRALSLLATARYAKTFTGSGAAALEQARNAPLGRGLQNGAQTISLTSPLAYRIVAYDGQSAKVVSWGVAVVGNDQGLAPSASWATTTTALRWQDDDWKIDAASSQAGPTPGLDAQRPSSTDAFIAGLSASQGVRHAP